MGGNAAPHNGKIATTASSFQSHFQIRAIVPADILDKRLNSLPKCSGTFVSRIRGFPVLTCPTEWEHWHRLSDARCGRVSTTGFGATKKHMRI
jgi:hypothetical protein